MKSPEWVLFDINEILHYENINKINVGKSLKCRDNNSLYLVSKKNAWLVDDIYFTKDSLLIRADRCDKVKNDD